MKLKSRKSALILSCLSLVLCFAMLVGSTFAWFTDTATTGVNKIQAGTLKVDIVKAEDETASLKDRSLNWTQKTASGRIEEVTGDDLPLWEPGCTFKTQGFKIKNAGNLALKYKITLNGVSGSEESTKLLDVIKFSVVDKDDNAVDLDTFVGHLTPDAKLSDVLYIQGHMEETADNPYQGLSLDSIGITVNATQDTVEYDSEDNQYDAGAPVDFVTVSTAEELKAVFEDAKAGENVNVSLNANVEISDKALNALNTGYPAVGDISIQGNGHTITNNNADSVRGIQVANSTAARTVTISDVNLKLTGTSTAYNAKENRGVQLYGLENATINLVNCNIDMTATNYSYAVKVIGSKNLTINMTGCTLTAANCIEVTNTSSNCTFNITDCVLNSNYNGTYVGLCIQDYYSNNNTYNVKNTTFNGTNARKCDLGTNSTFGDLGGNVDNTTSVTGN